MKIGLILCAYKGGMTGMLFDATFNICQGVFNRYDAETVEQEETKQQEEGICQF